MNRGEKEAAQRGKMEEGKDEETGDERQKSKEGQQEQEGKEWENGAKEKEEEHRGQGPGRKGSIREKGRGGRMEGIDK